MKTKIEQELQVRQEINKLGGTMTQVKLSDNMEWNLAAGEGRFQPQVTSSDPLLTFLQLKKEYTIKSALKIWVDDLNICRNVEPYVENICSKFGSTRQGDDAPERFMPSRSTEAPIKGGLGGKSPKQKASEHGIKEITIQDSLFLQQQQAELSIVSQSNLDFIIYHSPICSPRVQTS